MASTTTWLIMGESLPVCVAAASTLLSGMPNILARSTCGIIPPRAAQAGAGNSSRGGQGMERAKWILVGSLILTAAGAAAVPALAAGPDSTATPEQLVDTYRSLADTILGAKKT